VLAWLVVALAVSNALWPWAGPLMARVQGTQRLEWFWAGEGVKLGVVALVALPPAMLAGQVFPRLLRQFDDAHDNSRTVGALCTANVVGCVAGALVTGFALIPAFGAERTLSWLALVTVAGWLTLVVRGARTGPVLLPGALGLILLVILPRWNQLQLTGGYGVYLSPQLARDATVAFFREDFSSGFVTVTEHSARDRAALVKTLRQNGKFDADDAGEMKAQIAFGLVAGLHAPQLKHALVIGCGSGQTASVIARLGFDHVDIAELSPAHLEAARAQFGHINAGVLDRPGVTVHLEDGRNHLLRTATRYDVIQIELTSVWFAGATNLYSREFYALARRRLAPGGVLVQWIQLHHLTPRELASILATAQAEFSHVSVWQADGQACLLASERAPTANAAAWEKWSRSPALLDERIATGVLTPEKFAATQLVPAARLRALLAGTPTTLNTDRNRWLEFQTPKYYLSRQDHRRKNLQWLGVRAQGN
jgi:spermidine synthase